jgi:hypothetical protein
LAPGRRASVLEIPSMKRWRVSTNSAPGPALLFSFLASSSSTHWRTKQRDPHLLAPRVRWSSHRQCRGRRSPMTPPRGAVGPGTRRRSDQSHHPLTPTTMGSLDDRSMLARFISLLFALSGWRRVVPRAPAHERIRGGRAPSIRRLSLSVAKEFPRAHSLIEPARACRRHAGGPTPGSLRRHRGWRRRRRRPALGIIGGVVPQHRPQNAGQPAGQRHRRHRPASPRGDPQGPGP